MIGLIVHLLEIEGVKGKNIDIAKGRNKLPMTFKEAMKAVKNKRKWQEK